MPTVPTLDPQIIPSQPGPDARVTSTSGADAVSSSFKQMSDAGAAISGAGQVEGDYGTRMQQFANQTRVDSALNDLRTQAQKLQFDPTDGFQTQTGYNAVGPRQSGLPLADEFGSKLKTAASDIASTLTPQQQVLFQRSADPVVTQFHGGALAWEGQQFKSYSLSVQDGTAKTAASDMGLNWQNPDRIENGLNQIGAAAYKAGQINGQSAVEIDATTRVLKSNALKQVMAAGLQSNNPQYVSGLMQKYSSQMMPDDLLSIQAHLNAHMDAMVAMEAANSFTQQVAPAIAGSGFQRMVNITAKAESGGHETNPDGSTVTSPAGAQGVMQVMPTTNANPGFGVTPAQDNSPQERARVGRDYLQAMLQKYGDPAKAWAAYNAGPGALDDALKKATAAGNPGSWLAYTPKETQAYVTGNMRSYATGDGQTPIPTMADVTAKLQQNPYYQQRPEALKAAITAVEQRREMMIQARKYQDDQNVSGAMRTLEGNNGDWTKLDPAAIAAIPPKEIPTLQTYAKNIALGVNQTNPAVYQKLVTDPQGMAKMSDNDFYRMRTQLSESDFQTLAKQRGDLISGKGSNGPDSLDMGQINSIVNERLTSMGINTAATFAKDKQTVTQLGALRQAINDGILQQQKVYGKKFNAGEISTAVDGMFAKNADFRTKHLFGLITTGDSQPALTSKIGDIPGSVKTDITNWYKTNGVTSPTDGQILARFYKLSQAN